MSSLLTLALPYLAGSLIDSAVPGASGGRALPWHGSVNAVALTLAAVLAVHSIMAANGKPIIPFLPFGGMFTAILFGLLAIDSWQQLQRLRHDRHYWNEGCERDPDIWGR